MAASRLRAAIAGDVSNGALRLAIVLGVKPDLAQASSSAHALIRGRRHRWVGAPGTASSAIGGGQCGPHDLASLAQHHARVVEYDAQNSENPQTQDDHCLRWLTKMRVGIEGFMAAT